MKLSSNKFSKARDNDVIISALQISLTLIGVSFLL